MNEGSVCSHKARSWKTSFVSHSVHKKSAEVFPFLLIFYVGTYMLCG
jgi:hypothetical protein